MKRAKESLIICSLNVRSLVNNNKRRETFRWLKKKNYSIYFLQEMHCTNEVEHIWAAEWGCNKIFGGSSGNSAGGGILFNNNSEFQILKQHSDPQEGFIYCNIKTQKKILVNIYTSFECEQIIFGGDFNLILDSDKNKCRGNEPKHHKSLKRL